MCVHVYAHVYVPVSVRDTERMLAAIATAIVELTLGPIRGVNSFHLILGFDRVSKYVRASQTKMLSITSLVTYSRATLFS